MEEVRVLYLGWTLIDGYVCSLDVLPVGVLYLGWTLIDGYDARKH